jgi:hypothetical protein
LIASLEDIYVFPSSIQAWEAAAQNCSLNILPSVLMMGTGVEAAHRAKFLPWEDSE